MKTEEIDEERIRSGWNPYEGEEEAIAVSGSKIGKTDSAQVVQNREENREIFSEGVSEGEKQKIRQLQEQEEDLRRMQALYPHTAKILLPHIEAACDELEYEGSMMYDLRPDYETILRIKEAVQQKVKGEFPPMEPEERDELLTMQYHGGPRRRPGRNWLGDFIQTMLLEEMHRRRCRRCRMR